MLSASHAQLAQNHGQGKPEFAGNGGAKMLWGEAVAIAPDARANTRQLLIADATLSALEQLVVTARKEHGPASDFLVGLQLTHSGRWSYPTPVVMFHDPALRNNGRIITDDELDRRLIAQKRVVRALADRLGGLSRRVRHSRLVQHHSESP